MEQSILKSTKKVLNVNPDDDSFDLDVITHINSAFSTLNDMGVGPLEGFVIEDDVPVWDDFLSAEENLVQQSQVKSFVVLNVRLIFDPPSSSYVLASTEKLLEELTFRLSVRRENVEWVAPETVEVPDDNIQIDGGTAA